VRRGALLYRALAACLDSRACAGAALLSRQLTASGSGRRRLRVASLGGGPGTDVAGLFWAERHLLRYGPAAKAARAGPGGLDCTLYDLERSWRKYTPCLQRLMAPRLALDFQPCDVRAPLPPAEGAEGDGCNKALAAAAAGTHLFVLSYVAHETADAAASAAYAFYRSLALAASDGAVFIFLDVRAHAACVFDTIHDAMAAALREAAADAAGDVACVLERFALAPLGDGLPEPRGLALPDTRSDRDAAADADATLISGSLYRVAGGRAVFQKP
jgi:hypothetical protein